mgnify:CR=1 FL=1
MLNWRNSANRAIGVALILFMMMAVGGCGGSKPSSDPRSTPSGTLSELEKAIQKEDITAMLGCYTDPYYVTIDGETTEISHDIARIAYAIIFAMYDYSTWSLVDRNISVSGSEAFASCTQRMYSEGEWVSAPAMYRMCLVGSKWYIYEEIGEDSGYDFSPSAKMKGAVE